MKIKYFAVFFLSFLFFSQVVKAQKLLNIRIDLSVHNVAISEILKDIEQQGDFFFAYNPDNINETRTVSLSAQDIKVGDVLKELFQNQATFRQVENHIIISEVSKSHEKNAFQISGRIADNADAPLDSVIVYDPENEQLVISRVDGSFSFDLNTNVENIGLFISRPYYSDTIIYVGSGRQEINLRLYKRELSSFAMVPKKAAEVELKLKERTFESLSLVQRFVPPEAIYASRLNTEKIIPVQFSFLPKLGTNSFVKGLRVNNASFNVLAGYSKGLNGAEFGGIANIIQKEARGVQAAGIANIVLGDVHGVQLSGVYTNDFGDVYGFQMSGLHNTLHGDIRGGQISGVSNIALKDVNGTQVGGVLNAAKGNVVGAQVGGVLNMNDGETSGAQISGVANFSKGSVRGAQVAGVYNETSEINGMQLSGLANLNENGTKGVQITAILNKTKVLHGLQFGLVNIADTVSSGFQIGLINIVKHGTYSFELSHNETFPAELNFKTGNPRLHSIINVAAGNEKLGFGYGLGSNFPLAKKFAFSSDVIITSVKKYEKHTFLGSKISTRFALNYELLKHFKLTSGISGNYFIPRKFQAGTTEELLPLDNNSPIEQSIQNGKNTFWFGWFFGVQLSNVL